MSDVPALWINGGILVLTGVMALVAFVQARAALADADKADKAREQAETAEAKAVAAQEASAAALVEANRIAGEARDLLRDQDARETERHHVEWRAKFIDEEVRWELWNVGLDPALDVRLRVDSGVMPREVRTAEELPQFGALSVQFPDRFAGQGFTPRIGWRVEWRSPMGATHSQEGRWPTL